MPKHPLQNKRARGMRAEDRAMNDYKRRGYTIQNTHIGSDFIARKNGRETHVEVKSHHPNSKDHRPGSASRSPHPHLTQAQYNNMKKLRNDGNPNTSFKIWYD